MGGQSDPVVQKMPAAEVDVTTDLARRLLADQAPQFSGLELIEIANGWDNVIFRLGTDLAVRVPRRQMAAELVVREQAWLPLIADRVDLAVPAPVHVGSATSFYPWGWSVTPWFDGRPLGLDAPTDQHTAAGDLGAFLRSLHRPIATFSEELTMPTNIAGRGQPLPSLDERMQRWIAQLGASLPAKVPALWAELCAVPPWTSAPVLVHGDLHGLNTVVSDDRVVAVIDFGDIGEGDPAVDIGGVWTMLHVEALETLRQVAGPDGVAVDDDTWARARGWALYFAVVYLANSADHRILNEMGHRTLAKALEYERA